MVALQRDLENRRIERSTSGMPDEHATHRKEPHAMAVGDFNRDGKVDFVVVGTHPDVSVLLNQSACAH
jgi:hypothetical protein